MTDVWIVIPTYDEAGNVLRAIDAARSGPDRTVLIVDDDSPDGTGRIAQAAADDRSDVRVLHRRGRRGLAGAYLEGFALALDHGADVVVQMDADGSHDPADIARLVDAVERGADLAIGSRYVPGGATTDWGRGRRLLSQGGGRYARLVLDSAVLDLTGGFKAWRATALRGLALEAVGARGYAFQIELTFLAERAGLTVVELPIVFRDRRVGTSKMSAGIAVEALWQVPALWARHRGRTGRRRGLTSGAHLRLRDQGHARLVRRAANQ